MEAKLTELVNRLKAAIQDNLKTVVLYGSAVTGEFRAGHSDLNILCVVERADATALEHLHPVAEWWIKQRNLAPLIFTYDELSQSADVFAIELLDIKASHKTLFGQDVVAAIDVPMNLHRIEVEHELRTTLLRLRQHLLLSPDNEDELRAVLAKSITSVLTLFRHALIALGENPPHTKPQLLERAGEVFGFEAKPLQSILELRNSDRHLENLRELYYSYMAAVGRVAHELDARIPKRHLRNFA